VTGKKNRVFEHIYTNFRNGIIIWDGCRGYIDVSVDRDRYFRQLILDFRHKMLDMIFVVHSPSDVPPRLWGFASTAWIGATDALGNRSQVKTHSAGRIIEVQQRVNEAFRKAGGGIMGFLRWCGCEMSVQNISFRLLKRYLHRKWRLLPGYDGSRKAHRPAGCQTIPKKDRF